MARILITGCSTGVGRAAAEVLTKRGHNVIATARKVESLAGMTVAKTLALDVCDPASVTRAVAEAGPIDVLINNAGLGMWSPVELSPADRVSRLFETNVLGAFRMCQAVLPQMRAQRSGRILQISSGGSRRPRPPIGIYAASKAALDAFSMALRIEMRAFNITVAVVALGAVASNLDQNRYIADAHGTDYEAMTARMIAGNKGARDSAQSSEAVADVIADAVDAKDPPFRIYPTEAYGRQVEEMAKLPEAQFEDQVLGILGITKPAG